MRALALVPVGHLPRGFPALLLKRLEKETRMSCEVLETVLDPGPAYDPRRAQYNCRTLLPLLGAFAENNHTRVLGVANVDLFSPIFTFVLGEARGREEARREEAQDACLQAGGRRPPQDGRL